MKMARDEVPLPTACPIDQGRSASMKAESYEQNLTFRLHRRCHLITTTVTMLRNERSMGWRARGKKLDATRSFRTSIIAVAPFCLLSESKSSP
jgi:hypothetical protein